MALTTFGATVDLHAGGADLAFPHHAYEAAQAEVFTGVRPFARSWMHVGTVMVGGQKMAKSTGNLVFVHDLLERWPAAAIRYLILSRPWHESWGFNESELDRAELELEELRGLETKPGSILCGLRGSATGHVREPGPPTGPGCRQRGARKSTARPHAPLGTAIRQGPLMVTDLEHEMGV